MIKNVNLKRFITNTVFVVISQINKIVPKNDKQILLYANCSFRDNLSYLYDYLIDKGYNKKYKIVRSYKGPKEEKIPENVIDVNNLMAIWKFLRSGHVYYAFGKLPIFPAKKQTVIQMWHGSPFKGMDMGVKTSRKKKPYYTYYLAASDFFRDAVREAYSCDDKHIAICGNPRNDVMYEDFKSYDLGVSGKRKIIWMPTFRKSEYTGYSDIPDQRSLIPFFSNKELEGLNTELAKLDVGLIVKIHPAQDLDLYENINYSNICVLSHKEFVEKGYDLYRLLAQTDALITDYSSVFYDYMLLDKPIAFTMEDFEEYKNNRGFIFDNPESLMAGHKITESKDLINFAKDVSEESDPWKDKRREVSLKTNKYQDGQNRRRALEISKIFLDK